MIQYPQSDKAVWIRQGHDYSDIGASHLELPDVWDKAIRQGKDQMLAKMERSFMRINKKVRGWDPTAELSVGQQIVVAKKGKVTSPASSKRTQGGKKLRASIDQVCGSVPNKIQREAESFFPAKSKRKTMESSPREAPKRKGMIS